MGTCATCIQVFDDMDCISHAKCGSMVCAEPDGCYPGMSATAIAAEPCADCETLSLTDAATLSGAPMEALQPRGIPVRVLGAQAAEGEQQASYRIRNDGASPLVALVSVITFVDKKGRRASFSETTDAWTRGRGFLAPGEEKDLPLMTEVTTPAGLTRVVIRPVYAEFEDGTRVGVKAEQRWQCLRLHRRAKADLMRGALAAYRAGGDTALRGVLGKNQTDLAWLRYVLGKRGVAGVVEELTRERSLAE